MLPAPPVPEPLALSLSFTYSHTRQPADFTVEYVSAEMPDATELEGLGADFEDFKRIFERFTPAEKLTTEEQPAEVRSLLSSRPHLCGHDLSWFPLGVVGGVLCVHTAVKALTCTPLPMRVLTGSEEG